MNDIELAKVEIAASKDMTSFSKLTAIQALQEKLERENPQPLGLEELGNMSGEPVWSVGLDMWLIVWTGHKSGIQLRSILGDMNAKSAFKHHDTIYRHKPNIGESNNEGE